MAWTTRGRVTTVAEVFRFLLSTSPVLHSVCPSVANRQVRDKLMLTVDIRYNHHLRLGETLAQSVEVQGAVVRQKPYSCPRVARHPIEIFQKHLPRQSTGNKFEWVALLVTGEPACSIRYVIGENGATRVNIS